MDEVDFGLVPGWQVYGTVAFEKGTDRFHGQISDQRSVRGFALRNDVVACDFAVKVGPMQRVPSSVWPSAFPQIVDDVGNHGYNIVFVVWNNELWFGRLDTRSLTVKIILA